MDIYDVYPGAEGTVGFCVELSGTVFYLELPSRPYSKLDPPRADAVWFFLKFTSHAASSFYRSLPSPMSYQPPTRWAGSRHSARGLLQRPVHPNDLVR